jgi:ribosomal protein L37AE/L43A
LRAPDPIATMAITAATPITMPSMVRSERRALAPMAEKAERTLPCSSCGELLKTSRASRGVWRASAITSVRRESARGARVAAHIRVVGHEHDG